MRPLGVGTLRLEVTSEITADLAGTVSRYVAAYPDYSIDVEIDTNGGGWAPSKSIFTSLARHGRRVTAHIRKAQSGGALIAMGADFRHLEPDGFFLLHRPNGDFAKAFLDQVADEKARLMASRCRVPATRFRRWMDEDPTVIYAKRALECGLVDEVPGMVKPKNPVVFL